MASESLEIELTLEEQAALRALTSKLDSMSADEVKKMNLVFISAMRRSYPTEPYNEVESFVRKNEVEFMLEMFRAMKWIKKEKADEVKKKLAEETP